MCKKLTVHIRRFLLFNRFFRLLRSINKYNPYRIIKMEPSDFKNYSQTAKLFNYKAVPYTQNDGLVWKPRISIFFRKLHFWGFRWKTTYIIWNSSKKKSIYTVLPSTDNKETTYIHCCKYLVWKLCISKEDLHHYLSCLQLCFVTSNVSGVFHQVYYNIIEVIRSITLTIK